MDRAGSGDSDIAIVSRPTLRIAGEACVGGLAVLRAVRAVSWGCCASNVPTDDGAVRWLGAVGSRSVLEHHVGAAGAVAMDDRWFPIVIGTWWGEVEPALLDSYYAWFDRQLARAREEGTQIALVFDARGVTRTTAAIRRRFVHETDIREAMLRERVVGMFVVVRGALLLGMVAAIVTLVRGGLRLSTVGEPSAALERALAKLDHAGVARPAGLDPRSYAPPPRAPEP